jgi:hypothetical protein
MALEEFIAKTVTPGEPLTAQAWNEIVAAVAALNHHILSTEASSIRVQIANAGLAPGQTRVTAVPQDGAQAFEAVRPIPPGTEHVFAGLRPGVYTVRAEAPGFDAATATVTVPAAEPVSLTLVPRGGLMPALFGRPLSQALSDLKSLGIAVSRVLDIAGREVAPANPGAEYADAPVLVQIPAPGQPVPPESSAQLAVAAALQVEPSIEVPSLTGLSLEEAKKALEAAGLVLGKVENRQLSDS